MHLHQVFGLLLAALFLSSASLADPGADFLAARSAHQKQDDRRFEQHAARLPANHLFQPYLVYWRLKARPVTVSEWLDFAEAYPDTPLSDRARLEALSLLETLEDWPGLVRVAATLARKDKATQCLEGRAHLALNQPGAIHEAQALWHTPQDLPASCERLFADLTARGQLTETHRLERLRLALDADNPGLTRTLIAGLPAERRPDATLIEQARKRPDSLLTRAATGPIEQEIQLYALMRLAKSDLDRAAGRWQELESALPPDIARRGWGTLGTAAMRALHPAAVAWFLKAQDQLNDSQRPWAIRAMLRAGRWPDVYRGIQSLPETIRNEAVWRYWQARALKAMRADYPANQLFAQLSREFHYYGLLAYEELPVRFESRADDHRPTPETLRNAQANPGLARSLQLRELDLNVDAISEWEWAVRTMSDMELLAAAELARQAGWYDRAIMTAEKTRELHSIDLRYLTPYRDLAEAQAGQHDIDPAWVYGLMRQESRFVDYARSSAGAQGLMQIMPATARWIARQLGLGKKAHARMNDPAENIRFGTYYLKRLQDGAGGSVVLATAGYNAGPLRARRWQAEADLEGAIYVETIPFLETREYVKKVLANAIHYNRRLGLPARPLKDRLGIVPARAAPVRAGDGTSGSV